MDFPTSTFRDTLDNMTFWGIFSNNNNNNNNKVKRKRYKKLIQKTTRLF